ncbi:MAG: plastocyanin/azurin family copper-binding protein [Candidatus Thermoplasmatota archaeon]|nr:plastocyanin/azurin family copper-binding protein [Candidatus Thermoplasmatota archaeon]
MQNCLVLKIDNNTSVNTFEILPVFVNKSIFVPFCLVLFVILSPTTLAEEQSDQDSEVVIISVDSTNVRFSPSEVTLNEGDTIRFFWSGELLPHNAVESNGLFDSGEPSRNVDYSYTFNVGENGTYEFVCEPHESVGMVGTVNVEPLIIEPETENNTDNETEILNLADSEGFNPKFLGLELMILFSIGFLIYQIGRIRSSGELRLKKSEEE